MKRLLNLTFSAILIMALYITPSGANIPSAETIQSTAAVLINAENGQVLFAKNKDQIMYPASVTKIMTGTLALQDGNLQDTLTASRNAVYSLPRNTSHIALSADEQITLEQALYALAIESANDAANVIAEHFGGTNQGFAQRMNDYAAQLGCKNTNFTNPHGLPDTNHYTTAYDMALITAAAIKTPNFCTIFSERRYDVPPTNKKSEVRQFWNANYFLSNQVECQGLIMSKSGWTDESRHTLVSAAVRGDVTLIAVVLDSPRKLGAYTETNTLFDYGFENYYKVSLSAQDILAAMPLQFTYLDGSTVEIDPQHILADDFSALLPAETDLSALSVTYSQPQISQRGMTVDLTADISFNNNGIMEKLGSSSITAEIKLPEKAEKPSAFAFLKKPAEIALGIIMWLVILLFVWLVIRRIIILRRRRRRRMLRKMRHNPAVYNKAVKKRKRRLTPQEIREIQARRLKNQIYKD